MYKTQDFIETPKFGLADRQSVYRWLGGQSATSWPVAILFVAHMVFTGWLAQGAASSVSGLNVQIQDLITSGVSGLTLVFAGSFVRPGRLSLVRSIGIWLTAAFTGGISLIALSAIISGEVPGDLVAQSISGLLSIPTIFGAYTLLTASLTQTRAVKQQLEMHRQKLLIVGSKAIEQALTAQNEVQKLVIEQVSPVIEQLTDQIKQLGDAQPRKNVAEDVLRQIDQIVRPLSWEIYGGKSDFSQYGNTESLKVVDRPKRQSIGDWLNVQVQAKDLVSPTTNALIYLLILPAIALIIFGSAILPAALLQVLIIYLGLRIFTLSRKNNSNRLWKQFAITGLIGQLLALSFVFLGPIFVTKVEISFLLASAFAMNLSTLFIALFQGFEINRYFGIIESSEINEKLNRKISELQHNNRNFRVRCSRFIHGEVQSKLLTISLKLSHLKNLDENEISKIASQLEEINANIHSAKYAEIKSFDSELAQIIKGWDGVLKINVAQPENFPVGFLQDGVASENALEVIQEAFSNAVKHANATEVLVDFTVTSKQDLQITVTNELSHAPLELRFKPVANFGSQILDEVTCGWHREVNPDSFKIVATVSVAVTSPG